MSEEVTRWSVGEKFVEALSDAAASESLVDSAVEPLRKAMDDVFDNFRDDIIGRMPEAIGDELRYRTDKIIEALLQGDEKLLGSFMAAGGYRNPNMRWDGSFCSGHWVDVRRKITEANENLLRDERIADLTAERDALADALKGRTGELARLRIELSEAKDALHWANVRLGASNP